MINYEQMMQQVVRLNIITNDLAEKVKVIRERMVGRGISPTEAPIICAQLQRIENALRQIGADPDNLARVDTDIHIGLPGR